MDIAKTIKEAENKLDLKKKFPYLFSNTTRVILGIALLLIIILICYSYYLDGVSSFYVSCPSDRLGGCLNPLYDKFCPIDVEACQKEYLYPGETLGQKPSLLTQYLGDIFILILVFSFLLNYIIHKRRCKNGKFHNKNN